MLWSLWIVLGAAAYALFVLVVIRACRGLAAADAAAHQALLAHHAKARPEAHAVP